MRSHTLTRPADVTLGGEFGEPVALAARIHTHLPGHVPPMILNALEDLRVLGNTETFLFADGHRLSPADADKVCDGPPHRLSGPG